MDIESLIIFPYYLLNIYRICIDITFLICDTNNMCLLSFFLDQSGQWWSSSSLFPVCAVVVMYFTSTYYGLFPGLVLFFTLNRRLSLRFEKRKIFTHTLTVSGVFTSLCRSKYPSSIIFCLLERYLLTFFFSPFVFENALFCFYS